MTTESSARSRAIAQATLCATVEAPTPPLAPTTAMIDNPSDLVQPRSETPAYTMRRTEAFEKYRKGETTTTSYPESEKAKLSETGK